MTQNVPFDDILAALSEPVRRQLLDAIANRGEVTATVLAMSFDISRQGIMKHLAVLERAGLVTSRRIGREVLYRIRPEYLTETAKWLAGLADRWGQRLEMIRKIAEES